MHEPDLRATKAVLVNYLCEWMGGPKAYSASRGAPMLRRRHQPFDIDASARDAWMACMRQALAETCADEGLRAELDAAFYKIADFIRNTEYGHGTIPADRSVPNEAQGLSMQGLGEPVKQRRPHPGRPMEVNPHATPATHASTAAVAPAPAAHPTPP